LIGLGADEGSDGVVGNKRDAPKLATFADADELDGSARIEPVVTGAREAKVWIGAADW